MTAAVSFSGWCICWDGLKPPAAGAAETREARVSRPQGCAAGGAPSLPPGAQPLLRQVCHEPALRDSRQDRVLDGAAESEEGNLHRDDVSPGAPRLSDALLLSMPLPDKDSRDHLPQVFLQGVNVGSLIVGKSTKQGCQVYTVRYWRRQDLRYGRLWR